MDDLPLSTRSPNAPSSSTPRHLKRLSLSVSSLGSPGSPSPVRLNSLTSPRSQSPRVLRLSTGGPADGSPASAPLNGTNSFPFASTSTQSNPPSPTYGGTRSPGAPWSYPRASTGTSPVASGGGPRSGGHSRRMSSISYSSSREVDSSPRGTPHGGGAFSSPIASPSPSSYLARARAEGGPPDSLGRSRRSEDSGNGSRALNEVEEGEEDDEPARDESGQASFLSPARSGVSMGAQPTLTEVNSDLLSFIAKKERKVLELREELKRHDEELKNLKKKWESIVARSLASSTPPTTTSMPRPPTAAENSRRIFSRSSTVAYSPSLSSTPASPRSTVDVGLVSSPFDGPSLDTHVGPTPDIEIGESVQAAKAWMGGVLGKVLEAVGGMDDAQGGVGGRLVPLEEEEEPEEGAPDPSSSPRKAPNSPSTSHRASSSASASSVDEWRAHRASTTSAASTSTSSASSFGFGGMVRPPSDSGASAVTIQAVVAPPPVGAVSEKSLPPRPRVNAPSEGGHNRRRSTFDMLGSAAGSLGKRWGAISSSETFKSGRAAALNAVDTFERRLTETLGPLDGPGSPDPSSSPSSPEIAKEAPVLNGSATLPSGAGVFSSWKSAAPASAAAKERAGEQPKVAKPKEAEWDWSAFLEGPTEVAPTKSNAGGYRRPSLTPKASTSPNLFDDVVPTTALGPPLSPSSPAPYKSRRTLPSVPSPQQRTISPRASIASAIKEEDGWGW